MSPEKPEAVLRDQYYAIRKSIGLFPPDILFSPPGRFPLLPFPMDPQSLPEASLSTARKKKRTFVIEQLVFSHSRSASSRSQMDEVAGAPVEENDCRGADKL